MTGFFSSEGGLNNAPFCHMAWMLDDKNQDYRPPPFLNRGSPMTTVPPCQNKVTRGAAARSGIMVVGNDRFLAHVRAELL